MLRKPTAERQQEIEQAVLDLIATEGIQGLTMVRIASRIGVSEAALYRHFRGKLDIMRAAITAAFDRVMETITRAADGGSVVAQLRRVFVAHLRFIEQHPGVARILFSDEVHFNALELRRELDARIGRLLRFIADLLSSGVASGELSADLDVDAAAALYLGLVQTQLLLWSMNGRKERLTTGAERVWALYERAIK